MSNLHSLTRTTDNKCGNKTIIFECTTQRAGREKVVYGKHWLPKGSSCMFHRDEWRGWLTESGKRSATVFVMLRNAAVPLFLCFTKDSVGV